MTLFVFFISFEFALECFEENVRYIGKEKGEEVEEVEDAEECQMRCQAIAKCNAFTHNDQTKICTMWVKITGKEKALDHVSGCLGKVWSGWCQSCRGV